MSNEESSHQLSLYLFFKKALPLIEIAVSKEIFKRVYNTFLRKEDPPRVDLNQSSTDLSRQLNLFIFLYLGFMAPGLYFVHRSVTADDDSTILPAIHAGLCFFVAEEVLRRFNQTAEQIEGQSLEEHKVSDQPLSHSAENPSLANPKSKNS